MKDNGETAPDMLELRHRLGVGQNTLNIEIGIVGQATGSASGSGSVSSGGSVGGSTTVTELIGGGTPPRGYRRNRYEEE